MPEKVNVSASSSVTVDAGKTLVEEDDIAGASQGSADINLKSSSSPSKGNDKSNPKEGNDASETKEDGKQKANHSKQEKKHTQKTKSLAEQKGSAASAAATTDDHADEELSSCSSNNGEAGVGSKAANEGADSKEEKQEGGEGEEGISTASGHENQAQIQDASSRPGHYQQQQPYRGGGGGGMNGGRRGGRGGGRGHHNANPMMMLHGPPLPTHGGRFGPGARAYRGGYCGGGRGGGGGGYYPNPPVHQGNWNGPPHAGVGGGAPQGPANMNPAAMQNAAAGLASSAMGFFHTQQQLLPTPVGLTVRANLMKMNAQEAREYLAAMAVQQIEYYFTVDNLCRDTFLRSQLDEEGYVPLAIVCNFPTVASFAADYYEIIKTLKDSLLLEYDEGNETIRLKENPKAWLVPNPHGGMGVRRWLKQKTLGPEIPAMAVEPLPPPPPQQVHRLADKLGATSVGHTPKQSTPSSSSASPRIPTTTTTTTKEKSSAQASTATSSTPPPSSSSSSSPSSATEKEAEEPTALTPTSVSS